MLRGGSWVLASTITLALAGLAGCGITEGGTSEQLGSSVASSDLSANERRLLSRAEIYLVSFCMTREGFAYQVPPLLAPSEQVSERQPRYGNDDVTWAGTHGLTILPNEGRPRVTDPNAAALTKT